MARLSASSHDPDYVDTVRISAKEWQSLLLRLETEKPAIEEKNRRKNERHRYWNLAGLMVELEHPGGSVGKFMVQPRDLSAHGISFLHGSFIYQDTVVSLVLVSPHGVQENVMGKVVRCRHVKGKVHEVGVKFTNEIEVENYTDNSDETAASA